MKAHSSDPFEDGLNGKTPVGTPGISEKADSGIDSNQEWSRAYDSDVKRLIGDALHFREVCSSLSSSSSCERAAVAFLDLLDSNLIVFGLRIKFCDAQSMLRLGKLVFRLDGSPPKGIQTRGEERLRRLGQDLAVELEMNRLWRNLANQTYADVLAQEVETSAGQKVTVTSSEVAND